MAADIRRREHCDVRYWTGLNCTTSDGSTSRLHLAAQRPSEYYAATEKTSRPRKRTTAIECPVEP